MSVNLLEKVLWDLSVNRDAKNRYRADAGKFLGRYNLDRVERAMILEFDVRGLADLGVNTMLTMGYWMQMEGSRDMGEYLSRMNSSARCTADGTTETRHG